VNLTEAPSPLDMPVNSELPVLNPRRSVRGKLMRLVLATTAAAVCASGAAMLTYDLSVYRNSWVTDLASEASILGVSVAPALEFDDLAIADRDLGAMRVRPAVLVAALYTVDGRLYAAYTRDSNSSPPFKPPPHGATIAGERVELSQAVVHNGELLGTLYLRARFDLLARLAAYLRIFALVMAGSLAAAYVLSRQLQQAVVDPLDAMTGVARQIVQRRDYSLRASKTTDDEIGISVLAFNNMLDEVEARARSLETEVRVRQAAEAALRAADRRKDEFLATLAHELRNPLAPIRHAVRLLESKDVTEQQQQWSRSVIGRQVQRMALLLDDLLDVSRITRGQLNLRIDLVDLGSVVDAAVEVARPLIDAKKQQLVITLPGQHLMVSGDPLRLSQALSNLLTNAAKYTDEAGTITLAVELLDTELKVAVKDNGIGIDAKAIPGLFEIFAQLEPAIDRAEGGLGIGLALVKGLIALHGGRVEVVSPGVGLGSEFSFCLPRSAVVIGTDTTPPTSEAEEHLGRRDFKILMADDNRDAVDSMALLLELGGYQVLVAHTGRAAVAMAAEHRPDVVLLDIGMPDVSGHEVARTIRQADWGESVYLIAITGWGDVQDKERARVAGFDRHLTKPVDPDQLGKLLHELMIHRTSRAGRTACSQADTPNAVQSR